MNPRTSVVSAALLAAIARAHAGIPTFSRQTGLACSACHYQFPQLTPFGRLFKLNGYTLTGLTTIGAGGDSARRPTLKLEPIAPASIMLVTSLTRTATAQPGTQNNTASFPQQLSVFFAGELTPKVGAFVQFTYAAPGGSFGIDNVDVRFASHTTVAEKDLLYGITLHNNPTVQDVWNTVPAWSFPFMSSSAVPAPIASTLIEGALGQQVVGLGVYGLWNSMLYTEVTAYRSAPQGVSSPLDSTAANTTRGVIPYGRLALQHTFSSAYVMVGGFGFLGAKLYPTGVGGLTNSYTTLGADAQIEHRVGDPASGGVLIGRASFINERQTLDALLAQNPPTAQNATNTLSSFRANASYLPNTLFGATLGYFSTTGSVDTLLFAPGALTGSRTGSPNTSGLMGELSLNPWQNTRVGLQYVAYNRFNGASVDYDVVGGRRASDNNTMYLFLWVAF